MIGRSRLLRAASRAALAAALSAAWPAIAAAQSTASTAEQPVIPASPPVPSSAAPNPADEGETTLETLVVTATKRQERIQDIPMTVDAITGQKIQELGDIHSGADLVQLLPGVTFINSASNATSELNIRGAGQAREPNSDAAVGLFRNDAYIAGGNFGGRSFQRFDLFDIDNVEVLKGPQGALYGRNAEAGAINVISKKPDWTSASWIEGLYGSKDRLGVEGIIDRPINDTVAVRFGLDTSTQAGCDYHYISTSVNGGGCYDRFSYAAGRAGARWKPNAQFDATFTVDYAHEYQDAGVTLFRDAQPRDVVEASSPLADIVYSDTWNVGLNASYDFGWSKLVSTTNYRARVSKLYADPDGLTTNTEQSRYRDSAANIYQELRLQGQTPKLNWLVGADLFFLTDDYIDRETGYPVTAATKTRASQDPNVIEDTHSNQHSYGIYGSLKYNLTSRLSAEAQARYSIDDKSAILDDQVIATGAAQYTAFPPGSPQANPHKTFYNTSADGTLSYKFTRDVLGYARIGDAYRAGGFNIQLGVPCSSVSAPVPGTNCNVINPPLSYGEEHATTYEVGVKTGWFDRMLVINANVYDIDFSNILANVNNGLQPMQNPLLGAMFLANAGDGHEFGYEVEADFAPHLPKGWGSVELNVVFGHQEGKFSDVPAALQGAVADGAHLARLRPFSAQGNIVYKHAAFADWRWTVTASWISEDGGFQEAANTLNLDSYALVNTRVALGNGHWEFAVKAQNLTNSQYYTNQASALGNGLGLTYVPGELRYVEGQISYRW